MKPSLKRHAWYEKRVDNYMVELSDALLYERTNKLDSVSYGEFLNNVDDILKGIKNCSRELADENTRNILFDPEDRESEL